MKSEAIGKDGAGDEHEIIFWSGVTVVDATFDRSCPIEVTSSLKALSAALPPAGRFQWRCTIAAGFSSGELSRQGNGALCDWPCSLRAWRRRTSGEWIDFSRDAEVVTADYSARDGRGTLTLIEYPTPQMAIHSEKTLDALLKDPLPASSQRGTSVALGVRRSGPLVAVASGDFSSAEALALLAQVKYQADVTWSRVRHPQTR